MKKLLVILGPTATGKTDVALSLAKKFNGELVSADSRQVYIGLDIGTGKLPGKDVEVTKGQGFWKMDGIKVWMYDVADPRYRFTIKDYIEQATKVIDDIARRGKIPIIVGGTGFYIRGLLEGFSNLSIPNDDKLRGELQGFSLEELQKKLQSLSPARWESLNDSDRNNPRRLLRSIEIEYMNPYINTNKVLGLQNKYDIFKIGLTLPRSALNQRIDLRLISRINQGLIEEGEKLFGHGISLERMKELGLEYGLLAELLAGKVNKDVFIKNLEAKIHQYAKRQVTWFKKEKDVNWLDIANSLYQGKLEKLTFSWYYEANK